MLIKVLIITSGNYSLSPYIEEQVAGLITNGVTVDYFYIIGHNISGYLKNIPILYKKIKSYKPDIIHAHYGLSGLLAFLSHAKRLIVTYHGSDVNDSRHRYFSKIVSHLSTHNVFVEKSLAVRIRVNKNFSIIPCGINLTDFYPMDKKKARSQLGLDHNDIIILFSSSFNRPVKNFKLANQAINKIEFKINFIELHGYSRRQVMLLMNAADVCLLTSFSEGSPQFIKEAMSCNSPIVATDVGDIRYLFNELDGHFICSFNPDNVAENILKSVAFRKNKFFTAGRDRIIQLGLSNDNISRQILDLYSSFSPKKINYIYKTDPVNLTKSF